ncbi:MAG: SGNH/GDSL hydrolase family protein [Lentisphaeria bacterium]|nr:SGNH/GDSL hydrolase family protein [Lentisphaeria bacterium]
MRKEILLVPLLVLAAFSSMAEWRIGDKESILFAGDGVIVSGCAGKPFQGFRFLVEEALRGAGISVKTVSKGFAKETSGSLLEKMPSLLAARPDWMILSVGLNDVLGGKTTPEKFRENVAEILSLAGKNSVKTIVLTSIVCGDDPTLDVNGKLAPFNLILREEAGKHSVFLADVYKAFSEELSGPALAPLREGKLTRYRTSINGRGNFVIASLILEALGCSREETAGLRARWEEKYPAAVLYLNISFSQFLHCGNEGAKTGKSVKEHISAKVKNGR